MKVTVEAQAEPEWDESQEDPEFGLASETEWMKRAEIRVMAENGIDTSEIQWIEWGVSGYEEARWTIEAPSNYQGDPRGGLATGGGLDAVFQRVESAGAACLKYSFGSTE
jgi:hypothetical protein